ncbi:MAG TPA: anti-sigma factor [Terriglobales bacterium]|nr:anti-sigma factor [Terriglobales bacterium]
MTTHEPFADDLALLALGALEGEERATLEQHVAGCSACRQELERLRGDVALLALTATGPAPPERARKRLLAAIAEEPRSRLVRLKRPWWTLAPVFATIAMALFGILLWRENVQVRRKLAYANIHLEQLRAELQQQRTELEAARRIADVLMAPDTVQFTLVDIKSKPQPQGKAIYLQSKGALVFVASNFTPAPPGKAYELWLVPTSGQPPIPAGVFKPDARGSAVVAAPPLPAGVEAKAFAITLEPEQGSSTPTMPIIMLGAAGM